jgi:hypothetical protein
MLIGSTLPSHTPLLCVTPGWCTRARSMDKLFDLMMMGLKYQLMCSTKLEALQQVGSRLGQ